MPRIRFLPDGIEVNVSEGCTVLDAALDNEIPLDHNCGGNCACSTCHIEVEQGLEGLTAVSEDEEELLEEVDGRTENTRLACQCLAINDLVICRPVEDTVETNSLLSESETSL